jgi:hypothetical protein
VNQVVVDTVGVAFPVRGTGVRREFRTEISPRTRFALPSGGFLAVGMGEMAWVEASLPKRSRGENTAGVSIDESRRIIGEMVNEACVFVEPAEQRTITTESGLSREVSVDNPRIVRLDLVRDFQLKNPGYLTDILNGLANVPRDGRIKIRRFADGRTGRAETLRVGPASWAATLYDKHAESGGLANKGALRAEFRLRSRQLTGQRAQRVAGALVTVDELDEDRCELFRRDWFERVRFGSWVGSTTNVWSCLEDLQLTDRERIFFVGWLQARVDGIDVQISPKTERRYRTVLASLSSDSITTHSNRIRLNYDVGCEEVDDSLTQPAV